jgi:hypothetical protein
MENVRTAVEEFPLNMRAGRKPHDIWLFFTRRRELKYDENNKPTKHRILKNYVNGLYVMGLHLMLLIKNNFKN